MTFSGTPALNIRVIAVARSEWLVYLMPQPDARLISGTKFLSVEIPTLCFEKQGFGLVVFQIWQVDAGRIL